MFQRHPVQILHGNERTIPFLSDFVDGADIGMVEGRRRSGFPAESFQRLLILSQFFGEEFQRHKSAQFDVLGLIHHAHPAAA